MGSVAIKKVLSSFNSRVLFRLGEVAQDGAAEKEDWIPNSDESDEDDYLDEDAAPIERKQRQGVSAEVYGEHNKKGDYKPRVIEKT